VPAADGVAVAGGGVTSDAVMAPRESSDRSGLVQLEAGLERARARGRPLLLVHHCPEMAWEPTSSAHHNCSSRGVVVLDDRPLLLSMTPASRLAGGKVAGTLFCKCAVQARTLVSSV